MKTTKKIIQKTCVFVGLFFLCAFSFSCDSTIVTEPLQRNLFDTDVLEEYELSWLTKPQNATDEQQYSPKEHSYTYCYQAVIADEQVYYDYCEQFFLNLKKNGYSFGTLLEHVDYRNAFNMFSFDINMWDLIQNADTLSDYTECLLGKEDENRAMKRYYSSRPLRYYYEKMEGYLLMKPKKITISLRKENDISYIHILLERQLHVYVAP